MEQHGDLIDGNLVLWLKAGNEKAFEMIYERISDRLYGFVLKKIGIKEVAEEIVQEVFVALWNNRQMLELSGTLDAYLYGMAKNKIFSHMRSENVRKRYATEFSLFVERFHDNSLEEMMDFKDLNQILNERILELPNKCQTAFKMSRMEHATISQIAENMKISKRTVENYITQALRHLRAHINLIFFFIFFQKTLTDIILQKCSGIFCLIS